MSRPLRSIFGAYTLSLPACEAPKVFEHCRKKGIFFFSPLAEKDIITVKTSLFSCSAFISAAEEVGTEAVIVKREGLPFVISRYRKRYGIYAGIFLGAAALLYSSLFVWEIKVTGNVNISETEIKKVLSSHGVREGTFIPELDADVTAEYILLDYNPLSSLSINIKGTVANVDVIERVSMPKEEFPADGYCNLVAKSDGIITNVIAAEGHPEIKIGDVVTEGQLLINGIVENRYGAYKLVNSRGYVYADVTEKLLFEIPLARTGKSYTGKTKTKYQLFVLGYPISLFFDEYPGYQSYDITAEENNIMLFGLKLPFKISKAIYKEYTEEEYTLTEEEAKREAQKRLNLWIEKEAEGEIISIETEEYFDKQNNAHLLKARVVVNRNIALRSEILFTPPNTP